MLSELLKKYPAIGQFVRFGLIGGLNTGVDLVILNILMFSTGFSDGTPYTAFKAFSFVCAATFSYFMNKQWAFKDTSKEKEVQKFSQFFIVSTVGAVINVSVATIVVMYLKPMVGSEVLSFALSNEIWGSIGALFGTAVGLVWNFFGYKFFVFKK
ncbi:GtrA family protein [bacterium]|jgi:putative flippase GtrA|nr:GtrA family protein [bacterium]MBT4251423.1 GtrA family protein [bacterium]MBT4597397.1 GtrA family protein [bacterium]MBT6754236.1 GtrA family protein [bacterium]MBT7037562.1 GtrA family protein [bacterium]